MIYAVIGLTTLLALVVLGFMYQGAKRDRDEAEQRATDLSRELAAEKVSAIDSCRRLAGIIEDLKTELSKTEKELHKYASKDPDIAGDMLERLLALPPVTKAPAAGVPASAPAETKFRPPQSER